MSFDKYSELPRVHSLQSDVIDQIAAGEILERPAHMIKELLENSLDAGATEVQVEVLQGGRDVLIEDNGHGMHPDDIAKAFLRHATSKMRVISDLQGIRSFGFRGEALASVASVSRIRVVTRTAQMEKAVQTTWNGSEWSPQEPMDAPQGTRIHIQDLFGNVPARLKFLKSEAAEVTQIKIVLKSFALKHASKKITLKVNHQLAEFWSPAAQSLLRVKEVLGEEEIFVVEGVIGNCRARIFYSSPHVVQKTSKNMWFFVQGRWVVDKGLQAAVMEAYRNLLMHGEFPSVVVDLEVPGEEVDVNVHPTKSQIKFLDPKAPFQTIYRLLRQGLETAPWLVSPSAQPLSAATVGEALGVQVSRPPGRAGDFEQMNFTQQMPLSFREKVMPGPQLTQLQPAVSAPAVRGVSLQAPVPVSLPEATPPAVAPQGAPAARGESARRYWSLMSVRGQAHLTYLVCESSSALVLVDQHAAHERVLFEKLMRDYRGQRFEIQNFLFPLTLDMTADQVESLLACSLELKKMGIEIEALGPTSLGVKAAPVYLKESAIDEGLRQAAEYLQNNGDIVQLEKVWTDVLSRMACHSAVRAGQALSREEMQALLEQMDEFPMSSFCPHGRPVSQEWSWPWIEKAFGRLL